MRVAFARATGPPRSNSQYHSAKTMMFVSQMAPPVIRSGPGAVYYRCRRARARVTSRATDHALARLRTAARVRPSSRIARDSRLMRRGLAITRASSSSPCSAGSSQTGCSRTSRPGSGNCSATAIATATAACQRASPSVGRFHAGVAFGLASHQGAARPLGRRVPERPYGTRAHSAGHAAHGCPGVSARFLRAGHAGHPAIPSAHCGRDPAGRAHRLCWFQAQH